MSCYSQLRHLITSSPLLNSQLISVNHSEQTQREKKYTPINYSSVCKVLELDSFKDGQLSYKSSLLI